MGFSKNKTKGKRQKVKAPVETVVVLKASRKDKRKRKQVNCLLSELNQSESLRDDEDTILDLLDLLDRFPKLAWRGYNIGDYTGTPLYFLLKTEGVDLETIQDIWGILLLSSLPNESHCMDKDITTVSVSNKESKEGPKTIRNIAPIPRYACPPDSNGNEPIHLACFCPLDVFAFIVEHSTSAIARRLNKDEESPVDLLLKMATLKKEKIAIDKLQIMIKFYPEATINQALTAQEDYSIEKLKLVYDVSTAIPNQMDLEVCRTKLSLQTAHFIFGILLPKTRRLSLKIKDWESEVFELFLRMLRDSISIENIPILTLPTFAEDSQCHFRLAEALAKQQSLKTAYFSFEEYLNEPAVRSWFCSIRFGLAENPRIEHLVYSAVPWNGWYNRDATKYFDYTFQRSNNGSLKGENPEEHLTMTDSNLLDYDFFRNSLRHLEVHALPTYQRKKDMTKQLVSLLEGNPPIKRVRLGTGYKVDMEPVMNSLKPCHQLEDFHVADRYNFGDVQEKMLCQFFSTSHSNLAYFCQNKVGEEAYFHLRWNRSGSGIVRSLPYQHEKRHQMQVQALIGLILKVQEGDENWYRRHDDVVEVGLLYRLLQEAPSLWLPRSTC